MRRFLLPVATIALLVTVPCCWPATAARAQESPPATNDSAAAADERQGLHSGGKPWTFYPAAEVDDELPYVLLIGDSIMNGYHHHVIKVLDGQANIDRWLTPHHLNSDGLHEELQKAASFREYDVVHFNIGLHGWQEGRIPEGKYPELLKNYLATLKEQAPEAKLIWASITQVHEEGGTELNQEINPTIVERNKLAAAIMREEDVAVNDLYGLMSDKLHLAAGDRFHWKPEAYPLMAEQVVETIHEALGSSQEESSKPAVAAP